MNTSKIRIELLKIYQTFADRINISAEIANILHSIKDIKASGNEIEISLRKALSKFLPNNVELSHGHIIDSKSEISKQYDLIISNKEFSNKLLKAKDSTELFIFERVYAIGEVKKTWNIENLISTMNSIEDIKKRLFRSNVDNKTLIAGTSVIKLDSELSQLPLRNPLFTFAFAINSDGKLAKLKDIYVNTPFNPSLPNITIILNEGIFAMVSKKALAQNIIEIVLHPNLKDDKENYEWKFISSSNSGRNFAFLYYYILEHISTSILQVPPYLTYASSLLEIKDESILNLDEL